MGPRTHVRDASADLVDLTLLGNISDVRRLTAKLTRDELYARLHEMPFGSRPSSYIGVFCAQYCTAAQWHGRPAWMRAIVTTARGAPRAPRRGRGEHRDPGASDGPR